MSKIVSPKKPKILLPRPEVVRQLVNAERAYVVTMKSRIKLENSLLSVVAVKMGYRPGDDPAERLEMFRKAQEIIDAIAADAADADLGMAALVKTSRLSIDEFVAMEEATEKVLEKMVKQLPALVAWLELPAQRGFGLKSVGKIVGETGDLAEYPGPRSVWRRMGCAPWEFRGETRMGSSWKKDQRRSLPADEWVSYGYSPRRRSIMHVVGESLIKLNFLPGGAPGPYRKRYDEAKAAHLKAHPQECKACKGTGKKARSGAECEVCKGSGASAMWAHRHAHLLMVKLALKELWRAWRDME